MTRAAVVRRWILAPLLGLVVAGVLIVPSCGSVALRPEGSRLADCPGSPNCVNSQDSDEGHRVEALRFEGDPAQAWARLKDVVLAMPRTTLVEADDVYMHVEFRTAILRFVDDVQLMLDASAGVIHVRSASRVGYSDLGANRSRVEALREAWIASDASTGSVG